MAEDGKIKIDKFDGHDFGFWKMQIENYLQAMGAVRLSLAKNVAYNVVNEKTTYGLFKALSNMLMLVDIKFDDEVQALLLLSSLPESWLGTVTAVSGSTESTKLKFDNIRDLILGEDIRRKTFGEYSNSLSSVEDKGRGRKQDRGDKEVNMAARDYDDALVCCVENTIDDRIMDSGASFHATYCKEEYERFKLRSGKVRLADDKTLDIAGVGDVVLKTSFGTSWTLKDVRYIPGLKKRLISVGQLDEEGGNAALWHQRLGHMSEKGMKILASKGRIQDLQKAVVGFCELCVLGKQKKVSFVKSENTRKLQRLELVHTDVYGPTSVASIGGSRYYVTFIDDSSRKVWVYFLNNKFEVFNTFKKWKAAVENEANLRVKCLKSDNGGEYSSREFIEYCAKNGIRMLKTVPETPQQNSVAERMNRTLNERAKSMRLHAGLPKMFWEDSVTTTAYLINRGPSVPLGFQITKEEWQGKEVSLAHLRVFGCDSYVKVKDVARDKLDAKSVKCKFIGYGSDEIEYRFWDSKSHKVVRSRDATFNEDSLYGAKAETNSSNLTKRNQKDQVVLEDSPENLANKSIVTEHGLSLEITQSPVGSSDASEGSENSGSFKDSGRSDKEDSEDRVSSQERGSETPQLRRSTRESRAPVSKEFVQWKKAINEDMVSLEKNQTWSLVRLPAGKKALQSKWVFRVKEEHDGKKRYKARLVVKGFQHKLGVDYNEIFSSVVKMTTIRHLHDMTKGFSVSWERRKPRVQVEEKSRAGYKRCAMDHCCYLKKVGSSSIILLLYVDDMLVAGSDIEEIEFEMKDLGLAKQILGMGIIRDRTKGTLRLSQERYIGKVLEKFNMKDAEARCQPLGDHFKLSKKQTPKTEASRRRMAKVPYASAVGSVMYTMKAVKWLLRYLKGTSKATLCFSKKEVVLEGFSDSDYGGCLDSGKSTTGYVFTVGGTTVSWMSRIQKCVAMSTTEAEYMAIAERMAKSCEETLSLMKILGAENPADMFTKVVTT
ncbi:retrovirus-related pol polyprotein from transposon TNT 1-94 [Tanacetum coccineum]|uniref:Retrovirus-related pol polyprotein from transposon TNT 1-94 n=1 Tax=Tanacetum coccineum TaxID=301880 RepID=A0ABQ5BJT0_9ASTR